MEKEFYKVTIDGRKVDVQKGSTILSAARKQKINIPTLCFFEPLKPRATCRICVVEVKDGDKQKLVPSCNTSVSDGMEISTGSLKVINSRRLNLKALMNRNAESPVLLDLARDLDVEPDFKGKDTCILCGLCIQVCSEHIKANALSFEGQGILKKVVNPFIDDKNTCITCGACSYVCPTAFITFDRKGDKGKIWDNEFKMLPCRKCGKAHITERFAKNLMEKRNLSSDYFDICDECKRKSTVETVKTLVGWNEGIIK